MFPGETGSQAPSSRGKRALESESHKQRWRPPPAKVGKQGSDLPACPRQPQRDQVHAIMIFRPWPILRHSKRRDYCLGRVSKCSTGRKHLGRDLKDWTGAPRKARRKESAGTNSGERAAQKSPEIWKGPLFRLEPRTDQGHAQEAAPQAKPSERISEGKSKQNAYKHNNCADRSQIFKRRHTVRLHLYKTVENAKAAIDRKQISGGTGGGKSHKGSKANLGGHLCGKDGFTGIGQPRQRGTWNACVYRTSFTSQ